ncbi:unnamed protein product [Cunninghamella blakesleeana]
MSSHKRSKVSFDKDDYYVESSGSTKTRRGAVAKDAYGSDDEEVGGGAFSSDSEGEEEEENEQVNGKGKGKATTQNDQGEDNDDFDMFSSSTVDNNTNNKQQQQNKKKKKLDLHEIEGQEMTSKDQDTDNESEKPKLMAFNMKQEMEEGSFDAQGNYIRNEKDPEAFHDRWMEGISRKEMVKAKEAQFKRDQLEKVKEATRQSSLPQTEGDVYLLLIDYLLPGETVQEALTTLGKGAHGKIPAWKQKLLDKKNKNKNNKQQQQESQNDQQLALEKQQKVEKITELADQLMALGHFNVYEDTFEYIVRYLRSKCIVEEDWIPLSKYRK